MLDMHDIDLRRISALLLCELLYNNHQIKLKMVELLGIFPSKGRICVGSIPENIHKFPSTLKKCIELMHEPLMQSEDDRICWTINLERKNLKIQTLQYKKYSSFTFIDPAKNIFGFTIPSDYTTIRQSSLSSMSNRSHTINSDFYKIYIQARNRSKQSKRGSLNSSFVNMSIASDSLEKKSLIRPIISRNNIAQDYPTKQKQQINQPNEGTYKNTIQSISQYARNSYGGGTKANNREGLNMGANILRDRNQKMPYSQQSNTDSKNDRSNSRDQYIITDRQGLVSDRSSQEQKLYKKVRDILKR